MTTGLCVRAFAHSFEKQQDFEVIAEAGDGRTAVRLSQELSPDIVIMDVSMPELNGIEAARTIINRKPQTKVIALSMLSNKLLQSKCSKQAPQPIS